MSSELLACECGCGASVKAGRRFVRGHNGRIRQSRPLSERFWRFVVKAGQDECWLWSGTTTAHGYGYIGDENGRMLRAHRVAWTLAHGRIPDGVGYHGMCVLHRCDVRNCVNPAHLFLGSNEDNMADMVAKGRSASGERGARARLTESDVSAIRSSGDPVGVLAARYGVRSCTVSNIRAGRIWKRLTGAA